MMMTDNSATSVHACHSRALVAGYTRCPLRVLVRAPVQGAMLRTCRILPLAGSELVRVAPIYTVMWRAVIRATVIRVLPGAAPAANRVYCDSRSIALVFRTIARQAFG